ncbi:MAG: NTP transferase domain-containing protein [Actinobacteria bacterium]|nr:NTP transferase domain-containing protein [Actinomycetota bacterium]
MRGVHGLTIFQPDSSRRGSPAGSSPSRLGFVSESGAVDISAVILAAGASSRLGEPKQLLVLEGKPLLQHVVDVVASCGFAEIVVVLGHAAEEVEGALDLPEGARVVVNPDHAEGQSISLHLGLASVSPASSAAAIFLGDQPRLSPAAIGRVVDAFRSSGARAARAVYRGTPGHPVIVTSGSFGAFGEIGGDVGARAVLDGSTDVVEVALDMEPPLDIDTPADFESLQ